jgi:hypothetical protein
MSFAAHIDAGFEASGTELGPAHPFLELGNYSRQIRRYLEFFPPEQIQVNLYDDYCADRAAMLHRIFVFLGVDPSFEPDCSKRYLKAGVPRSATLHNIAVRRLRLGERLKRVLSGRIHRSLKALIYRPERSVSIEAQDRDRLIDYYRDEVLALSDFLERDLSHWLSSERRLVGTADGQPFMTPPGRQATPSGMGPKASC